MYPRHRHLSTTFELTTSGFVIGCFLSMFVTRSLSDEVPDTCRIHQPISKDIVLCHHEEEDFFPWLSSYSCHSKTNDTDQTSINSFQGFVVSDLKIAPRAKVADCFPFTDDQYLDAKCLREEVKDCADFDASVFDLLQKVSGKSQLHNDTHVQRVPLKGRTQGASVKVREDFGFEDSSAMVCFPKLCKPARPAPDDPDNQVINMCSAGRVNNSHVYLTLQDTQNDKLPEAPSLCRCRLHASPSHSLSLTALDIRLQHVLDGRALGDPSVTLQIRSENQIIKELKAQGWNAWYGSDVLVKGHSNLVLDLFSISSKSFPLAIWIEITGDGGVKPLSPVTVECEGIRDLSQATPPQPQGEEHSTQTQGNDVMLLIIGISVGSLILVVLMVTMRKRIFSFCNGLSPIARPRSDDAAENLFVYA